MNRTGERIIVTRDLQAIIDALPGIYLVVTADEAYTMVAVSEERLRVTMTRRDEVIGKRLFEVYTDDPSNPDAQGVAALRTSLEQVIASGRTQRMSNVRYSLQRPDEDGFAEHCWDVINAPVFGPDGKVRYIIHRAEDVTQLRQSQEHTRNRLRQSDERLNAALLASGTGTFYWDLASNRLDMDVAMQRLVGLPQGNLSLDALLQRVHRDDRPGIVAQCERCARLGEDFEMQFRVQLSRTGLRWLFVKAQTGHDTDGRQPYLVGACLDITGHKRTEQALHRLNETLEQRVNEEVAARASAEAALRQSQKMEAVGQLTGGLAHDFNNLLAGIIGSLELIELRVQQGRTGELARYVEAALGSASRATALTHRLLAFARQQTLDPSATDVNALVGGMMELLQRTTGPLIEFRNEHDAHLWLTLCDANQLENALLNLTLNARDAMPDGGRLTLTTRNASLDRHAASRFGLTPGDYVTLSVSDTGSGIAPEKLSYVFDPFFTTKPLGEGTGLGLSMVYGFAKQSGGGVHIESSPAGTTVRLFLPRHFGEPRPSSVKDKSPCMPERQEGRTVLVVDDEDNVRMLVVEVMQELGHQVLAAACGASALEQLGEADTVDLLISDIGLAGGMNGRQLADLARLARPGLKVLFITGYAEETVLERSGLHLDYEVLVKPFSIQALEDKVQAMLEAS
ncbi:ATP-binding protein [Pseudomonas sp.]|uniref:ATP-binding protein n=1 Tax=Pseudomonas sp. TaxID=306 RepID=UPI003D1521B1